MKIDWAAYTPPKPTFLGARVFETYDVAELVPYIDWTPFFQTWELKGRYPAISTTRSRARWRGSFTTTRRRC
jgi:5-methyltetrahydrofolate--homocysteine methyltransferase